MTTEEYRTLVGYGTVYQLETADLLGMMSAGLPGYGSVDHAYEVREGRTVYVAPLYCGWGDYSGSSVDGANLRAIREEYADLMDPGHDETARALLGHSGYGYETILVRADVLLDEHRYPPETIIVRDAEGRILSETETDPCEEDTWAQGVAGCLRCRYRDLRETLGALHDYPLVNEETHSELEQELQEEAMQDVFDARRAMQDRAKADLSEVEAEKADDYLTEVDDDTIRGLVYHTMSISKGEGSYALPDGRRISWGWEYHGRQADLIGLEDLVSLLPLAMLTGEEKP